VQANLAYLSVLFWTASPDLTVVIILIPVHKHAYYFHHHCQGGYVMPHIRLSVCPLATFCRNYRTNLKLWKVYVSVDKEEWIKFWNSSACESRRYANWKSSVQQRRFSDHAPLFI